jgi:hypothetical protein
MTANAMDRPDALTGAGVLAKLLGPIESVERHTLGTVGYSGATLERIDARLRSGERRSLVSKRVCLVADWPAVRTGDTLGREAALLGEPALAGVWDVFACPYLACSVKDGEIGLLMTDLSECLLPDVDEPLTEGEEDAIISSLARLHARFWDTEGLAIPWLNTPDRLFGLLGPSAGAEESGRRAALLFRDAVRRGWDVALTRLPAAVAEQLRQPAEAFARECAPLPRTLLHGDTKVANFALLDDGRVAAFDWALIGAGPCTLDLGWYLAVNAGRLARSKEDLIAHYRALLEAELGHAIPSVIWERLLSAGLLCGAAMGLWEKALALETGTPRASDEWDWWVRQLARHAP